MAKSVKFIIGMFIGCGALVAPVLSQPLSTVDASAAFGARTAVRAAAMSPDGSKIAFIGPGPGQSDILYVLDADTDSTPRVITKASGDPERLYWCSWVSNDRLACKIGGLQQDVDEILGFSNFIAINADGSNLKLLSKRMGANAVYRDFRGGAIIDLLPDSDGRILMQRTYVPEARVGQLIENKEEGIGVDEIDTRTGSTKQIEKPRPDAVDYISDGLGNIRIIGRERFNAVGYSKGSLAYSFRPKGTREWKILGDYDGMTDTGFYPSVIDPNDDLVYGFSKENGRQALVSISLADPALARKIVLSRPDVDVDGLIQIGKRQRVVGASYAVERREIVYFDLALKKLAASLGKALPNQPIVNFVDSSLDETKLLIHAEGDKNPGIYYIFDRTTKKLRPLIATKPELAEIPLAAVQSVSYPAADGTMIPGYLTLPPGSDGKNLPTIVMPHGGPSSRDEWGFDWLSQYFANRGFAVLQPNFRGSSGYGDSWYRDNGFKSWRISVGDVNDAGKWLAKNGTADPRKLFIFGWSYGGYAALQSTVLDPGLFKAIVAVAPVTDLDDLKTAWKNFTNRRVYEQFIGTGPHTKEGSPAQNADKFSAPVLMFHGVMDRNVRVSQSRLMANRLRAAGKQVEYVEYPKLEHQLDDSAVRAAMLKKSADFLLANAK